MRRTVGLHVSVCVCVCVVSSLTVCFIVNLHKLVVCLVLFKLNLKTGLEVRNNRRKLTRTWLACVCVCVYTHYLCKCVCVSVCARDSLQLFTNRRRATTTTTVAQLKSLVCSPSFSRLSLCLLLPLSLFL